MNVSRRAFWAMALGLVSAFAAAQRYSIVDLTAGSPFQDTGAYGISQDGHVTGYGTDPNTGELHAFVYYQGTFHDLGDLGYVNGANGSQINDAGMISGVGYPQSGFQCFLYANGVANPIGGNFTEPNGMNSHGDIVGRERRDDGGFDAFSYIGGNYTSLTNLISASGINDSDAYVGSVGYFWYHNGVHYVIPHGYIYLNGSYVDLGSLGGPGGYTEALSINNSNQVTGDSMVADGTTHAFRYDGGSMTDLGTFSPYNTFGVSINDSGQVAGNIQYSSGAPYGAFLYSSGVLHNFADIVDASGSGWSQLVAYQINNKGYVVGYGTFNNGTHGFLARPADVDLPSAYAVVKGQYGSGSLSSLFAIDGSYLVARTNAARQRSSVGVTITLDGTSTQANPSDLRLLLTAHVNSTNLGQKIEMYDYAANAWVVVDSAGSSLTDSTETAVATNPARFVQSGTHAMKARLSWNPTGNASAFPWSVSIDQAVWNVSP